MYLFWINLLFFPLLVCVILIIDKVGKKYEKEKDVFYNNITT